MKKADGFARWLKVVSCFCACIQPMTHHLAKDCSHAIALMGCVALMLTCGTVAARESVIEGITFAVEPGKIYLPLDEAIEELRLPVVKDVAGYCTQLADVAIPAGSLRRLTDQRELVSTTDLQNVGIAVTAEQEGGRVRVGQGRRDFIVVVSPKRVEISLAKQQLQGWQGERLVLQCRISSGRNGRTPAGEFHAGPYKARMHRSSRYNNAPMPWSVQINGHVFIHGFTSVPNYPASHGCIRVPLNEGNPAKFFYEWVDTGTPVSVARD